MRHGFDYTRIVLYSFAAVLVLLIVAADVVAGVLRLVDKDGALTAAELRTLIHDPTLLDPLITTFTLATLTSVICCIVAARWGGSWRARHAVADGATPGDASFVDAALSRRHRLGVAGGANSGLLINCTARRPACRGKCTWFNVYSFSASSSSSPATTFLTCSCWSPTRSDRMPGDLEDASSILGGKTWDTARRITIRWSCRRSWRRAGSPSCRL